MATAKDLHPLCPTYLYGPQFDSIMIQRYQYNFLSLIYAHFRYVKCLITNIQKQ